VYLFDIDGTLLETNSSASNSTHKESFTAAMSHVFGVDGVSISEVDHSGKTDVWILRLLCAARGVPDSVVTHKSLLRAQTVMVEYCAERLAMLKGSVSVLPGVEPLLNRIRATGACLGLVTGNLEGIAEMKIRAAGLGDFFSCGGFGSDAEDRAELVARAAAAAAARAGVDRGRLRVFHCGDTPYDLDAAHRAGARGVGVCTGSYSAPRLRECAGDHILVENFCDAAELTHVFELA
jgi:phosphoglycolate phosphatase-like HAD superfamily hydrolase